MDGADLDSLAGDCVAVLNETINGAALGHRHSDPLCLHVEFLKQQEIRFVNRSRRLHAFLQFVDRANMIDVRMRADDLLRL